MIFFGIITAFLLLLTSYEYMFIFSYYILFRLPERKNLNGNWRIIRKKNKKHQRKDFLFKKNKKKIKNIFPYSQQTEQKKEVERNKIIFKNMCIHKNKNEKWLILLLVKV